MNELSNTFSLLDIDVEDAKGHTTITTAADGDGDVDVDGERVKEQGNGKRKDNHSGDGTPSKNENEGQQSSELIREEYKLPLVWVDLEMTGLDIEVDRILEIACIITDGNLTKSIEGPDLVIHQSKECLDKMGEWCQQHHGESGLTEKVHQSTISEQEAEKQNENEMFVSFQMNDESLYERVCEETCRTYTPLLAGNSVYVDLLFLKKFMPNLAGLFTHILVDVSSVKALCHRWYPRDNKKAPRKENKHRALDDIKESIAELKYYKENIFKPKYKK